MLFGLWRLFAARLCTEFNPTEIENDCTNRSADERNVGDVSDEVAAVVEEVDDVAVGKRRWSKQAVVEVGNGSAEQGADNERPQHGRYSRSDDDERDSGDTGDDGEDPGVISADAKGRAGVVDEFELETCSDERNFDALEQKRFCKEFRERVNRNPHDGKSECEGNDSATGHIFILAGRFCLN